MEVTLYHHVYSSLVGYRTLFTSPGLPKELVEKAEALAKRCYQKIGRRPMRAHYRAAAGWTASVRGLQFGTDHVGRPRTLVHTIFMRDEETGKIPYFSPFMVPGELFLADGADLQYLNQEVRTVWEHITPPVPPGALLERSHINIDLAKKFLPALMDLRRPTLILDAREHAFDFTWLISYFLPPNFRTSISYLDGAFVPPVDGGTNFQLNFFANRPDPSILQYSDWIIIDIDRNDLQAAPVPSIYTNFMLSALGKPDTIAEAVRLVGILEVYERHRVLERGYLTKVVDAYRVGRDAFLPDGRLAVAQNPAAAFDAIPLLVEAQCFNLVHAICHALAQAQKGDVATTARKDVDDLAKNIHTPVKAHQIAMAFHTHLAPVFGREPIEPPSSGLDDSDTLMMPGLPKKPKNPDTSTSLPSVPSDKKKDDDTTMIPIIRPEKLYGKSPDTDFVTLPPIDDHPPAEAPEVEKCPKCGLMTVTREDGRKVCLSRKCTYREDLDYEV